MRQAGPTTARAMEDLGVLRFLTCGSVDDGKSTLIGRLLYDLDLIPEDQLQALERAAGPRTTEPRVPDLALLLDGLEAEREQGITIDVAYRYFGTARRAFIVADAPGHEQYTRNMATGASVSDLALLLVDANRGISTQTRRHVLIAGQFGIRHLILAVNKLDLVGYGESRFRQIVEQFQTFAAPLGFASTVTIPVVALHGDNVARRSSQTPWYDGPTLIDALEAVEVHGWRRDRPLRIPVQWVCRTDAGFRGFSGTVTTGRVVRGDTVMAASSGATAVVASLLGPSGELDEAVAGAPVTVVLEQPIDVGRGEVFCHPAAAAEVADQFAAHLLWLAGSVMLPGRSYLMKLGCRTLPATVTTIKHRLDVDTGAKLAANQLRENEIAFCTLATPVAVPVDPFTLQGETGCFLLIDRFTNETAGAGMIAFALRRGRNVHPQRLEVDARARSAIKGHKPAIVWFTGLSAAGKSTIANRLERRLNVAGIHTYLVDGDNVRGGLNRDLGFTHADRVENVRRVAEVAALFADAGLVVLVCLISPFRPEREFARERAVAAGAAFVEVFVDTSLEECRRRDPKGLYAKATAGDLPNFSGIDSPYEPPLTPDVRLETEGRDPESLAAQVTDYLRTVGIVS